MQPRQIVSAYFLIQAIGTAVWWGLLVAYLLSQLAGHDWNLEQCAESLGCRKNELVLRLKNAGFGYLLHQHVLDAARAKERKLLN